METKRAKRIILGLCLAATVSLISTGCGDKDDPKPANNKITMKFTLTVTGADQEDQVDFAILAGNHDASQYGAPVWKINGQTQGNENTVLLDEQDFVGSTKTYVVETVKGFDFGKLDVHCTNSGGAPITLSYKAEVDGKAETNVENLAIPQGQSHAKDFTYEKQ